MPNHPHCRSSRSGKNKTAKITNLQSKLSVTATPNNPFEISGHAFIELPSACKHGKMNESFKLPVLNPIASSRIPAFFRPTEITSPILTCPTEWKVPAKNESTKSDSNSQPSFIGSVSASESESWSDDLENEMTAQLMANITRIDDMFYSSFPITSNRELFQEIKLWQDRFPFLRICGKKAKIVPDNKTFGPEAVVEKEEVIFNDKFNDSDDGHSVKRRSELAESKNSSTLKQEIRNSVINHLTNHFIIAVKNELDQSIKHDRKVMFKKSMKAANSVTVEALDVNENRLKVKEDLDDLLNISPISLKVAAPKSNYLSSFAIKKSESIKSKATARQSTHLRIEHKLSTKIVHTLCESPPSTMDNVSCRIVLHQNKSSLPSRKPFESSFRKNKKVSLKNNGSVISNAPRFGTLPPLKTPGLRPTSAVYSSYNKLPSESRPTSSFILAPCFLKTDSSTTDES